MELIRGKTPTEKQIIICLKSLWVVISLLYGYFMLRRAVIFSASDALFTAALLILLIQEEKQSRLVHFLIMTLIVICMIYAIVYILYPPLDSSFKFLFL